jgi:hypothetical protein
LPAALDCSAFAALAALQGTALELAHFSFDVFPGAACVFSRHGKFSFSAFFSTSGSAGILTVYAAYSADTTINLILNDLSAHSSNFRQPARLKYWTARSCFSAAARVLNVPRFRRLPVFGLIFRE